MRLVCQGNQDVMTMMMKSNPPSFFRTVANGTDYVFWHAILVSKLQQQIQKWKWKIFLND